MVIGNAKEVVLHGLHKPVAVELGRYNSGRGRQLYLLVQALQLLKQVVRAHEVDYAHPHLAILLVYDQQQRVVDYLLLPQEVAVVLQRREHPVVQLGRQTQRRAVPVHFEVGVQPSKGLALRRGEPVGFGSLEVVDDDLLHVEPEEYVLHNHAVAGLAFHVDFEYPEYLGQQGVGPRKLGFLHVLDVAPSELLELLELLVVDEFHHYRLVVALCEFTSALASRVVPTATAQHGSQEVLKYYAFGVADLLELGVVVYCHLVQLVLVVLVANLYFEGVHQLLQRLTNSALRHSLSLQPHLNLDLAAVGFGLHSKGLGVQSEHNKGYGVFLIKWNVCKLRRLLQSPAHLGEPFRHRANDVHEVCMLECEVRQYRLSCTHNLVHILHTNIDLLFEVLRGRGVFPAAALSELGVQLHSHLEHVLEEQVVVVALPLQDGVVEVDPILGGLLLGELVHLLQNSGQYVLEFDEYVAYATVPPWIEVPAIQGTQPVQMVHQTVTCLLDRSQLRAEQPFQEYTLQLFNVQLGAGVREAYFIQPIYPERLHYEFYEGILILEYPSSPLMNALAFSFLGNVEYLLAARSHCCTQLQYKKQEAVLEVATLQLDWVAQLYLAVLALEVAGYMLLGSQRRLRIVAKLHLHSLLSDYEVGGLFINWLINQAHNSLEGVELILEHFHTDHASPVVEYAVMVVLWATAAGALLVDVGHLLEQVPAQRNVYCWILRVELTRLVLRLKTQVALVAECPLTLVRQHLEVLLQRYLLPNVSQVGEVAPHEVQLRKANALLLQELLHSIVLAIQEIVEVANRISSIFIEMAHVCFNEIPLKQQLTTHLQKPSSYFLQTSQLIDVRVCQDNTCHG